MCSIFTSVKYLQPVNNFLHKNDCLCVCHHHCLEIREDLRKMNIPLHINFIISSVTFCLQPPSCSHISHDVTRHPSFHLSAPYPWWFDHTGSALQALLEKSEHYLLAVVQEHVPSLFYLFIHFKSFRYPMHAKTFSLSIFKALNKFSCGEKGGNGH